MTGVLRREERASGQGPATSRTTKPAAPMRSASTPRASMTVRVGIVVVAAVHEADGGRRLGLARP